DQLDLIQAEKLAVGKQLDRVQNMMTSGMARKTELYEARARFAKTQADAITALSDLDDKREALQEIVGPLTGALAVLNPDISLSIPDPETPQHWMELAVAQNPRVIMQQQQVEISRYEIRLNKAGHLPTVDFTARVNELDSGGSVLGNDNELETTEFVLRLNLPIYQGGAVTSNTRRSSQLHQKALQDLTSIQRTVRRAAKSAYNGIVRAISLVDAQKETVSAQQLALLARQQGYRSGLYTNLDVLDAERDVFEAKRDLARARYDYLLNHLSLKHSIGSLNEQDIADINRMLQPAASRT
ncbi:MAG: TolC family protein, partial [Gammaproteobacteria bacterium]|nr:TolC family protein [Gammaproteobacteria bacterium]